MITAQEIREKTFEKAVFGGYDMATIDSFLETIATDLDLLQKENATLKAKMKVLVSKVEEYRGNEDALRMAVVSAQRLGNMIEAEAKAKAETMVRDAEASAAAATRNARLEVEMEKARLEEAKKASARFVENMELLCNRQMTFLQTLGEMDFMKEYPAAAPAAEPQPAAEPVEIHETVKSIEETVAKVAAVPESAVRPDFAGAEEDVLATRAFRIVTDPSVPGNARFSNVKRRHSFAFVTFAPCQRSVRRIAPVVSSMPALENVTPMPTGRSARI